MVINFLQSEAIGASDKYLLLNNVSVPHMRFHSELSIRAIRIKITCGKNRKVFSCIHLQIYADKSENHLRYAFHKKISVGLILSIKPIEDNIDNEKAAYP